MTAHPEYLASILALCGGDGLSAWAGAWVVPGLVLAGLAGSALHCAPMCGPFVLGQVADGMACLPGAGLCEAARLRAALLLPYHLGRCLTYAGLGAAAGGMGGWLAGLPWMGRLSGILLVLAAALFALQAARRLLPRRASLARRHTAGWAAAGRGAASGRAFGGRAAGKRAAGGRASAWGRAVRRAAARIDRSRPLGGVLLGAALGFLPCGFLYGALTAAAASGSPLLGAAGMAGFGLGTAPALVAVGLAGGAAGRRWNRAATALAPAALGLNAAVLLALGLGRMAGGG